MYNLGTGWSLEREQEQEYPNIRKFDLRIIFNT